MSFPENDGVCQFWPPELLQRMKHTFSQERKTSLAISLSFDQFQLGHVSLNHPVIDRPGEAISHRVFIFLNPGSKRLEFRKFAAFYLVQPGIELLAGACAEQSSVNC